MGVKTRCLHKYDSCKGLDCEFNNNVLVKTVYSDVLFIPLCIKCLSKHRKNLKKYKKSKFVLSDYDVTIIYFQTLNMI